MRKLLLIGGAAALIAVPAQAWAGGETVPEKDPLAEEANGAVLPTTDKALRAEGDGVFRYAGSGGVVIAVRGYVRVRDDSAGKDLVKTPTGFTTTTTSPDGLWTRYTGEGTLSLDGSAFTVGAHGDFAVDADPSATHAAAGLARVSGTGTTILKGGLPIPFWANNRVLLATGPMAVDVAGEGRWKKVRIARRDRDDRKDHKDRTGHKGEKGEKDGTTAKDAVAARRSDSRARSHKRVWVWRKGGVAAWRLNGPAAGTVAISALTGRVRVWDASAAKDLAVVAPAGTTSRTLTDGSVVYNGLKKAAVSLTGSSFRIVARGRLIQGTFTPTPGTFARGYVRGKGTFDAGAVQDLGARGKGVRVLLQPALPGAPL